MDSYSNFISTTLRESGKLVLQSFGQVLVTKQKEDQSQVVTDVDIASENQIVERIKDHYPDYSIIAEESGFVDKKSEYVWIVDPIDGTSNFAQGIPWFGVMIALLKNWEVIASGIYLPVGDELLTAERGKRLFRNGQKVSLPNEVGLNESLISFCTDSTTDASHNSFLTHVFTRLLPKVRNLRATNSAVDLGYVVQGKLGGVMVFKSKIWDVAPVSLLAEEAGLRITDDFGNTLNFSVDTHSFMKNYAFVIARHTIHTTLIEVLSEARNSSY